VKATIVTNGSGGQLDSRLWDVAPDSSQMLVSRGAYRLTDNQTGAIAFQLNGNAYHFGPGHTVKLELLGNDSTYLRKSNGSFTVNVSNVTVTLPTTTAVAGATQAGKLLISVTPRRAHAGQRVHYRFGVRRQVGHGAPAAVRGAVVILAGHRATTNGAGVARVTATFHRAGLYNARVTHGRDRAASLRVRILP
jgi:hypothetical protein